MSMKVSRDQYIATLGPRELHAIESGDATLRECDCGCIGWLVAYDAPIRPTTAPRVEEDNPGDSDLLEASKVALLILARLETLVQAWAPFMEKKYHAARERLRSAIAVETARRTK